MLWIPEVQNLAGHLAASLSDVFDQARVRTSVLATAFGAKAIASKRPLMFTSTT